jgi:hypothetical protein
MTPIKVKMLHYGNEDEGKKPTDFFFKTQYIDGDKISSFYIEEPLEIQGKLIKCYALIIDGEFFSYKPEQHLYDFLFDKLINKAIKLK